MKKKRKKNAEALQARANGQGDCEVSTPSGAKCVFLKMNEDAQGTPSQNYISPSILVYEVEPQLLVLSTSGLAHVPGNSGTQFKPRLVPSSAS